MPVGRCRGFQTWIGRFPGSVPSICAVSLNLSMSMVSLLFLSFRGLLRFLLCLAHPVLTTLSQYGCFSCCGHPEHVWVLPHRAAHQRDVRILVFYVDLFPKLADK